MITDLIILAVMIIVPLTIIGEIIRHYYEEKEYREYEDNGFDAKEDV